MDNNINRLLLAVEEHKALILSAERQIWKNPESGYREWKTHAYMKEQFEKLGYTVTEAGNIPGFYVDVDTGRPGPKFGIFAEMDSLIVPTHPEADPQTGAVHACGHHCQCAAMLGIAAAFKTPGALEGLSGSIRLIVVPAEELIEIGYRAELKKQGIIRYFGGKVEFMHRGILDGVDLSMMVHTSASDTFTFHCGKGSNGCITKEATFIGKGAHAGGQPHMGHNALYAATLAMQAANSLRETFREADTVRFHPIITKGGDAVNAIPDQVCVESYIRAANMSAMAAENEKVNRAFAAAAVAMNCDVRLSDLHGYAPRINDPLLRQAFREAAEMTVPAKEVVINESWSTGCSDMGDINSVMPGIHPGVAGAVGSSHSNTYRIKDPYTACVLSAKVQVATTAILLQDNAKRAQEIIDSKKGSYPTIREYLDSIDKLSFEGNCVTGNEDGTITIKYKN